MGSFLTVNNVNIPNQSKRLTIGDKLYANGSWSFMEIEIVSINDSEAISKEGYRFNRDFNDGDSYINKDLPISLDFQNWFLANTKK